MMKKLLAGISVAAITASSAFALDGTPANVDGIAGNAIETLLPLANELDGASESISATFEFQAVIDGGGAFPAGDNIDFYVNLPSGIQFSTTGGNDADATAVVDGTQGAITGASLTAGGADGIDGSQNQFLGNGAQVPADVRLLVSIDPNAAVNQRQTIGFRVDLDITTACEGKDDDDIVVIISAFSEFGTRIDLNDAIIPIIQCTDAYVVDFIDSDEDDFDTFVTLDSDYNLFNETDVAGAIAANPGDNLNAADIGNSPLGEFSIATNLNAVIDVPSFNSNAVVTFDPLQDVEDIDFVVNLSESTVGLADIEVSGEDGTAVGSSFVGSLDHSDLNDGDDDDAAVAPADAVGIVRAFADANPATRIASQDVSLSLTANYDSTRATFVDSESGDVFCGDGDLDRINREGREFGFFDWVSESGSVNTVFRVTGLDATEDTPYQLEFTNSRTGQNGVFEGVILAADVEGTATTGESRLRSRNEFAALNPGYGRADVKITFESNADIDVDRLISSNGVVASFGDGSNEGLNGGEITPTSDDDQLNGDGPTE